VLLGLTAGLQARAAAAGFLFLLAEPDSRYAALAGSRVSSAEGVGGLHQNPAAAAGMAGQELSFAYLDHVQDLRLFSTAWATGRYAPWVLSAGLLHLGYGKFEGYDEFGRPTRDFGVSDNLVHLGLARHGENVFGGLLKTGVQLKVAWSRIEDASARALAFDLGATWSGPSGLALGGRLLNQGAVLKEFADGKTSLPGIVEIGLSKALAHLPFTWSLSWQKPLSWMNHWDRDSFFRAGGEFLIAGRWHLGVGYDFGRGEDRLRDVSGDSSKGLSAGVGGRLPGDLAFHWSWSSYGELGSLNRFTIAWTLQTKRHSPDK